MQRRFVAKDLIPILEGGGLYVCCHGDVPQRVDTPQLYSIPACACKPIRELRACQGWVAGCGKGRQTSFPETRSSPPTWGCRMPENVDILEHTVARHHSAGQGGCHLFTTA